jgi:hypothetical protein
MKPFVVTSLALLAAICAGGATRAATYHYTDHWDYIRKPSLGAEFDARLQADAASCDSMVGAQRGAPTSSYRSCMLQRGWKFLSVTRVRVPTPPSDPNFSSNARLKPGHFISHDTGMDCENIGGASVCSPPNGTVHYYDPEQGLNCTRSGLVAICSNM